MTKGYLVVIKDLQGWRMAYAEKWDGVSFTSDNGDPMTADTYLATLNNMRAVVRGSKPLAVKDNMYWPMKAEEASTFLGQNGYALDKDLRIYPTLGEPFMDIKAGMIAPMVAIHLKSCQEKNKNPESEPLLLVDYKGQDESGNKREALCVVYDTNKLVPIPNDTEHPGKFAVISMTNGMKQICLTFQDHYFIPKGSNVLMMHKFLMVEEGPESLEELTKIGQFIDKDGVIRWSGKNSLAARTLSIDDFFE